MLHDLFAMGIPIVEKIVRTMVVYFAIVLLLRLGGKRDLAQLNTFDLVVILLLSNVVQNAIIGNDNSLTGGLIGAVTLVLTNAVWVRVVQRNARLTMFFEGTPTEVVHDGQYVDRALRRLAVTKSDVDLVVRRQGANDVSEVEHAWLEPRGQLVVTLRPEEQNATKADVDRLIQRIGELESRLAR